MTNPFWCGPGPCPWECKPPDVSCVILDEKYNQGSTLANWTVIDGNPSIAATPWPPNSTALFFPKGQRHTIVTKIPHPLGASQYQTINIAFNEEANIDLGTFEFGVRLGADILGASDYDVIWQGTGPYFQLMRIGPGGITSDPVGPNIWGVNTPLTICMQDKWLTTSYRNHNMFGVPRKEDLFPTVINSEFLAISCFPTTVDFYISSIYWGVPAGPSTPDCPTCPDYSCTIALSPLDKSEMEHWEVIGGGNIVYTYNYVQVSSGSDVRLRLNSEHPHTEARAFKGVTQLYAVLPDGAILKFATMSVVATLSKTGTTYTLSLSIRGAEEDSVVFEESYTLKRLTIWINFDGRIRVTFSDVFETEGYTLYGFDNLHGPYDKPPYYVYVDTMTTTGNVQINEHNSYIGKDDNGYPLCPQEYIPPSLDCSDCLPGTTLPTINTTKTQISDGSCLNCFALTGTDVLLQVSPCRWEKNHGPVLNCDPSPSIDIIEAVWIAQDPADADNVYIYWSMTDVATTKLLLGPSPVECDFSSGNKILNGSDTPSGNCEVSFIQIVISP